MITGRKYIVLPKNQNTYIALGVEHQLENHGMTDQRLILVQSDNYFGENYIVRFEYIFGKLIAVATKWAPLRRIDLALNDTVAREPNFALSGGQ